MGTDAIPGGGMREVALINVTKTEYQYKYNGKELQDELGLNMYDMDMRQYDPAIARWVVQDPVTHFDFSPYNAFDNDPVFWADPSGADATSLIQDIWNKSNANENTLWLNNNNGTFLGSNGKSADCDVCTTSTSKLTHTFSPEGFNYKNKEGERGDANDGSDIIEYKVQVVTKNEKGMVTSSVLITYFFSVNRGGSHENIVPGTMYIMGVYDPVNVSFNIDNPVTPYEKELAEYISYVSSYSKKYNSSILDEIATYNYYLEKNKEGPYKTQDMINKVSSAAKLFGKHGRMVGGAGNFINTILKNQNQSSNLHGVKVGIVNENKL
ncbi:MAG TPA: RHS repeat-associated core domain-containing protein [Moheibacter sp.]|nr:RHS repeat-associated core domain-containing protein [Moheibacter sp.]